MSNVHDVILQSSKGEICRIPFVAKTFRGLSIKWSHTLGNKMRWRERSQNVDKVCQKSTKALESLGVTNEHLNEIANAGVVEVVIPNSERSVRWAAQSLPWEHWFATATHESQLVTVRHLKTGRMSITRKPKNVLFVETAPGRFRDSENFDAERDFVNADFRTLRKKVRRVVDPTLLRLEDELDGKYSPDVIHMTGVDAMMGYQLLSGYLKEELLFFKDIYHGMYLRNERDLVAQAHEDHDEDCDHTAFQVENVVSAERLSQALTSAEFKPSLVCFHSWYSALRLAPNCIAHGATTAIGCHNAIDENVARLFYLQFYRTWLETEQDTLAAYIAACDVVSPFTDPTLGSAIVLWSGQSLVQSRGRDHIGASGPAVQKFRHDLKDVDGKRPKLATPKDDRIHDLVGIDIKVPKFFNYSMLHNGRSLLEKMHLWFKHSDSVEVIQDVDVEISLQVGTHLLPYRSWLTLGKDNPQIDLADATVPETRDNPGGGIFLPLISEIVRELKETVHTNLFVHVKWHDQTLYRRTHAVAIAPVNEWKTDTRERCWLPSFVQPRSPAVSQIVTSAEKYLRCLTDDRNAGFDGYQDCTAVQQVQAIWTAIVTDFPLGYIGPASAFTPESQRLRTPGEIIESGRGTCADLALLFAACLEWIELFPVLINLEQHQFAGYWVSEYGHKKFFNGLANEEGFSFDKSKVRIGSSFPWIVDANSYDQIEKMVLPSDGEAPLMKVLETTFLAKQKSFAAAHKEALEFFTKGGLYHCKPGVGGGFGDFEGLIDVKKSREFVTPLPLC